MSVFIGVDMFVFLAIAFELQYKFVMANTKSAQKNIRKSATRTEANRQVRSRLKTLAKSVEADANDTEKAKTAAVAFVSALDKAAKTGIIHQNVARRHKSSVAKYIYPNAS